MQTKTYKGRTSAVTGVPEDVTISQLKADLSLSNVPNTDFTAPVNANTAKVTNANHTGEVTGSGSLTITNKAVVNAKLADMQTKTYKGRTSAATGVPEDVTISQLKADLDLSSYELTANSTETLITTGGSKNNEATPTKLLRFSNLVTPTILSGLANPSNGKIVRIINNTLQNLSVLNESLSSNADNRLLNINSQDLFIVVGGAAEYVYSDSLKRWVLSNIWATDYFASLIGIGKRAVSVTSQGYAVAEPVVDLKIWDNAKTTVYTKSQINITYPLLSKGQQVVCPNITGGGVTYEKYDDSTNDWISIITPKLT